MARLTRRLRLTIVVALELRMGVRNNDQQLALDDIVDAFRKRDRILVPSADAFLQAGRLLSEMSTREGYAHGDPALSLTNDALIAASCREAGVTLATNNAGDFARIQRYLRGFRFVLPAELL